MLVVFFIFDLFFDMLDDLDYEEFILLELCEELMEEII